MRHQVPFFLGFYRRQYFTHPLGEGGMAAHENRHIGPQLKAKSRQLIFRETAAPQMVERHQHGGGIGGATAQAAAHRQALIDTDIGAAARRQAIAFAGGMHQQTRGANDQILLVRHAGGALTTGLFFHPHFSLPIPHYGQMRFVDILSGIIVALIAIAVGMVAVWCLPRLHALMHRLKNPILTLGIGGLLLGIVGTIGGPLTLFKGLDEMQQLAFSQTLTAADFLLIALVKLAALVLASASGFRGGRIFPAVFVGVALGLMLHAHVDAVPAAITVSCAILGMVLVVTRDGWLSLFMAAVVVPDTTLLPLLCMVMLPAWLLLAGRPLMIAKRHTD